MTTGLLAELVCGVLAIFSPTGVDRRGVRHVKPCGAVGFGPVGRQRQVGGHRLAPLLVNVPIPLAGWFRRKTLWQPAVVYSCSIPHTRNRLAHAVLPVLFPMSKEIGGEPSGWVLNKPTAQGLAA